MPTIASAVNVGDGATVTVTLGASPSGAASFFASIAPGSIGDGPLYATGSGVGPYVVHVRTAALTSPLPIYLTARDLTGDSAQVPEWVCFGSNVPKSWLIARALHGVLQDHKAALERLVRVSLGGNTWPDGSPLRVERLLLGGRGAGSGGVFPVVAVMPLGLGSQWAGMPLARSETYRVRISCHAIHDNPVIWESALWHLASACQMVLEQRQYVEFSLASGLWAKNAQVGEVGVSYPDEPAGGKWIVSADVEWSAELLWQFDMETDSPPLHALQFNRAGNSLYLGLGT